MTAPALSRHSQRRSQSGCLLQQRLQTLLQILLLTLLQTLPLTLLWPGFAAAHVGLATTVPDHDAVLERAPTRLVFDFMAEVTITNARLEITSEERRGERIDIRLPRNSIGQSTAFGQTITLELPALAPGTYQVLYQAVALGGDILIDDFSFTVQP
ncbi:MAG: copper resistance CopC family protein [Pseudohongiellaceae bacterium]|jgi:methionine-rich copper-binding protein CopC